MGLSFLYKASFFNWDLNFCSIFFLPLSRSFFSRILFPIYSFNYLKMSKRLLCCSFASLWQIMSIFFYIFVWQLLHMCIYFLHDLIQKSLVFLKKGRSFLLNYYFSIFCKSLIFFLVFPRKLRANFLFFASFRVIPFYCTSK